MPATLNAILSCVQLCAGSISLRLDEVEAGFQLSFGHSKVNMYRKLFTLNPQLNDNNLEQFLQDIPVKSAETLRQSGRFKLQTGSEVSQEPTSFSNALARPHLSQIQYPHTPKIDLFQRSSFDDREFEFLPNPNQTFYENDRNHLQSPGRTKKNYDNNCTPLYENDLSNYPLENNSNNIISATKLPDRFRKFFSFKHFNKMQSDIFQVVFNSDKHVVVSSPTGSGKTVLMELAIIRLLSKHNGDKAKIVYIAPMKALCHERVVDWKKKFAYLGIGCSELTGDTEYSDIGEVQRSNIVVTTPEKWDSMTRRWRDHKIFMNMLKLVLIDEIHTVKDADRGSTLEVLVSRMNAVSDESGTSLRILAVR